MSAREDMAEARGVEMNVWMREEEADGSIRFIPLRLSNVHTGGSLAALARVEAELARLTAYCESQDWHTEWYVPMKRRAEAAEADAARLRDGLRQIEMKPYRAEEVARALLGSTGDTASEESA